MSVYSNDLSVRTLQAGEGCSVTRRRSFKCAINSDKYVLLSVDMLFFAK
jgi:hypothetical protein